jgi:pilus assembly protein Flp/PilA
MNDWFLKWSIKTQIAMMQEEGQDLVEYSLVIALIAFGAVASIKVLGQDINSVFNNIGTKLTSAA